MSEDPIGDDLRRARRERRLGPGACCLLCGEHDPVALVRVGRSLLERHHVAGAANDREFTAVVCRNCHARETERMRDAGIPLRRDEQRTLLERLEAVLRGLALFLTCTAQRLAAWADRLAVLVVVLDRAFPAWRELPEAGA